MGVPVSCKGEGENLCQKTAEHGKGEPPGRVACRRHREIGADGEMVSGDDALSKNHEQIKDRHDAERHQVSRRIGIRQKCGRQTDGYGQEHELPGVVLPRNPAAGVVADPASDPGWHRAEESALAARQTSDHRRDSYAAGDAVAGSHGLATDRIGGDEPEEPCHERSAHTAQAADGEHVRTIQWRKRFADIAAVMEACMVFGIDRCPAAADKRGLSAQQRSPGQPCIGPAGEFLMSGQHEAAGNQRG